MLSKNPTVYTRPQSNTQRMCDMVIKQTTSEPSSAAEKRRQVTVASFKKWQSLNEREHQALSRLRCDNTDEENHRVVDKLWLALQPGCFVTWLRG